jgi:agmatinase
MTWNDFDPNAVTPEDSGIYGLPFTTDEAQVVLVPAPWAVTVSYGGGAQNGPKAILEASPQIDYYHPSYGADTWKLGLAMLPIADWDDTYAKGIQLRRDAEAHIEKLTHGRVDESPTAINQACEDFHTHIEKTAETLLHQGKLVGVVGGDHSTPLGLIKALAKKHNFGILQLDAHCDLREAYEGFTYSHASIMWNALKIPQVAKLVQVGVRDYAIAEKAVIDSSGGKIQTYFDADLQNQKFAGISWKSIVEDIVASLPDKVYLSFDIDGLDPALCPGTGTPVPGGLSFQEAIYLIEKVATSGRTIIGFDLNEVSPRENNEWDANVGMRVLWNLSNWAAKSNNLHPLS